MKKKMLDFVKKDIALYRTLEKERAVLLVVSFLVAVSMAFCF
jgi:hypothetical protein